MRHNSENGRAKRTKKSSALLSKIMLPMIILALLQCFIFVAIFTINGGFSYVKRFSYNMISEKTENRKNYIENLLNQKTEMVYETAQEVNEIVGGILAERHLKAADIKTDKELDKEILVGAAPELISLIRRNAVNDAFIILASDGLYDEEGKSLRTGLYIRDMDVDENSALDNTDIYMEMGSSETARSYGLALDSGWALYMDVSDNENDRFAFFYEPMRACEEYSNTPLYYLGYWSKLDSIAKNQQGSVKYSLPLVSEDGTVYGVIGIGILAKTIQKNIPANDFFNENSCYILGADLDGSGSYDTVLYSGPAYRRLVKENTVLSDETSIGYNLYDFTAQGGEACIGSIQRLNLYSTGSPYRRQQWALISVADKDEVLTIYRSMISTVMISALLTLGVCVVFAIFSSRSVSYPVARMVKVLGGSHKDNAIVEFQSSGITEIDLLADSIVALQREVTEAKDDEYTAKLLEANKALQDAYAAAKRANYAKTDFLSRMSHDIRTPMNAIIGMTTIARANLDNREKLEDCLEKITVSSHYLLSLINEVLDMSKIESGKLVLAEEKFNILTLAVNLVEMVKPSVKEKKHEFSVETGGIEHEAVIGDTLRIQQVFMNIMSNAVKYTPEGGHIYFSISEKPMRKKVVGCYQLIFADDGIGMSPEFLEKIYEPFERAEDERVNKEQGTGLGMAITYNIVKMMGGDIKVESRVGEGTKFTVTLYLKLDDTRKEQPEASDTADGAEGKEELEAIKNTDFSGSRVLLVDDNELNREIATEILGMTGLMVETAQDGKEALEKFEASKPGYYNIIFLDIQMPVMNGYEAARAIRALPREDALTVSVVAMTANAFAEDVQAAKEAGMNDHIAKPLDIDRLLEILREMLGRG